MLTVSLPDRQAVQDVERAGGLPDDVTVIVWDGLGRRPAGADVIDMFVAGADVPAAATMRSLPNLRVFQVLSAGVERWLDVVPDGVALYNGRGVHGAATAELALTGLLAVLRDIPAFALGQQRHEWERSTGDTLDGRRVLIVGAGDIGDRIAASVESFGARTTKLARTARDGVHGFDELAALLPHHDVVALAVPLTPETEHLVDAAFLAAMPAGAVLVNVSRGAIVETDALVAELGRRRLRAFLDVTDPEPLPADHPLWDAPGVLITPHVGSVVHGWQRRGHELARSQILRLRNGEPLVNRVEHGY